MLCTRCHGTRFVFANGAKVPCPECGGMGEVHCCDGLTEQPDPVEQPTPPASACPVPPPRHCDERQ